MSIPDGIILWENPNPTEPFAAQKITLSSSNYDILEIFSRDAAVVDRMSSTRALKGHGIVISYALGGGGGVVAKYRIISYISDTELDVLSGQVTTGTTAQQANNASVIPIKIIGYKL